MSLLILVLPKNLNKFFVFSFNTFNLTYMKIPTKYNLCGYLLDLYNFFKFLNSVFNVL